MHIDQAPAQQAFLFLAAAGRDEFTIPSVKPAVIRGRSEQASESSKEALG